MNKTYIKLSKMIGNKEQNSKTETATIMSIIENNAFAMVKKVGENNLVKYLNKSGEILSVGDSVKIETNGGSGYISMRNGTPKYPLSIVKCTQSQYETWEINGQIDINKLYGIILEE